MTEPIATDAELTRKLGEARIRILARQPFFGLLLLHLRLFLDDDCPTAATDGQSIFFGPAFLAGLSPLQTCFVLLHETVHIALGHVFRRGDRDVENFNIACDIVTNSTILGEAIEFSTLVTKQGFVRLHLAPDGQEGRLYSAEEVFEMLQGRRKKRRKAGFDDHGLWGQAGLADQADQAGLVGQAYDNLAQEWEWRIAQAAMSVEARSNGYGDLPLMAARVLKTLRQPRVNWRELLQNFIKQEIFDYSFSPPDRRFQDSPFLLPDWNEPRDTPGRLWFVVDCSGSVSDDQLTTAYSEICGALENFGDSLDGLISFFDATVSEAKPFGNLDELKRHAPTGGGGTSFRAIFLHLKENLENLRPDTVIVLTDGYSEFPPESAALGIPVLWLIDNLEVNPPWGKVARIC
jgi:predicted metal-dependent peptidase